MSVEYDAQSKVLWLGVGGFILAAVSAFVAVQQWPDTSLATGEESGNAENAFLALAVCGLAQTAVFIAVVACGVRLGVRWSGLSDALSSAARSTELAAAGVAAATGTSRPGTGAVGAPPVHRQRGDLSGIEPLGPVVDRAHMDRDGL
ncbi:hypothetical protein [Nocardioides sp. HB32]